MVCANLTCSMSFFNLPEGKAFTLAQYFFLSPGILVSNIKIGVSARVERPCYRAEYVGRDKGNPHDPIYNAVGRRVAFPASH